MATVSIRKVSKTYTDAQVIHDISMEIADGEFVVMLGPSGCGKSTLLRMVAGLERITSGEIAIDGRVVNELEPKDRNIAMVFQNYALYPHMSVFDNMAYGLKILGLPKQEIETRVRRAADILELTALLDRRPRQLSGGQRQRVAMGRAIVRLPEVFLFDEPLSNLDAKLRVQMRTEIKKIHQRVKTTIVYVTHDQVEAMTLADRIVVMNAGVIEQVGSPYEMYENPATRFVAGFIGSPSMNFVPCKVVENGGVSIQFNENLSLRVPDDRQERYRAVLGRELIFGIRPEHLTEKKAHTNPSMLDFSVKVEVLEPMGMDTMVFFNLNGEDLCARSAPKAVSTVGNEMMLTIDMSRMHLIDPQTDKVV